MNIKNIIKYASASCALLLSGSFANAQLIGGDGYLIGDHVEIGINGAGGHEGAALLAGSNNRSNLAVTSPVYFGFVANPQLDGWTEFDGDFFTPGTPENGFGLEINGTNYGNNATGGPLNQITGSFVGYTEIDDCITLEWEGEVDSVTINVKYNLLAGNLFYTTEVTLTNNSGEDLTDLYYYRNVDPDNNVTQTGSYVTVNTIVSQADATCEKSLVSATQSAPWDSYVGFGALGDKFRVAFGGFSNRDASDIWNGVGALTGTEGATNTSDQAIAIAYKTDLDAGESANFTFAVVLSEDALESAFQGLYYINFEALGVSGGSVASACNVEVDTAATCGGNPVTLTMNGPNVGDFTWEWTPIEGLSETAGITTEATPTETTIYTATGTPVGGCLVVPIEKTIVIEYLEGPQIEVTDPGVICDSLELATLVYEDVNGVPGTVTYFFTEIPDSATQTGPVFGSDYITEDDSVYLFISDPVNGCFDYVLLDFDYSEPVSAGDPSTSVYCAGDASVINLGDMLSDDADLGGVFSDPDGNGGLDAASGNLDLGELAAGDIYDYYYTVGDSACGFSVAMLTIFINEELMLDVEGTDASCGVEDGSATAVVTGGTPTYSYVWSTGATTATIDGLGAGDYTVTVTDIYGCTISDSVTIEGTESTIGIDKLSVKDVSCPGGSNGKISVIAEGGVEPYTYDWSTGAMGPIVTDLSAGTYTVTITDALGCSIVETITVEDGEPVDVTITNADGTLTANEDDASYQWVICPDYEVIDGATEQSYTPEHCEDLEYAVIITTEEGCIDTSDCSLPDPKTATITDFGSIEVVIYPNPTTGMVFVQLEDLTADYQLTVTDAKGSIIVARRVAQNIEAINLNELADGVYFVQIKSDNAIVTKRISLKR